jgi:hypothetical protein
MATAVQVESIWNGLTDNSGQPLANGKVYCYYAGTTTPAPLYTSSDKTSQATNPLILDGYGRSQVWADGRLKFVVKTSADVTLYTLDNLLYGFDDTTVLWGGQSTGAANAQVVSVPATIGSYSTGQQVTFIAGYTNTGATTLQFNALAAASIVKGPTPSSLQAGDLIAGNIYTATYEAYSGTGRFRLSDYPTVADFQLSRSQYATNVAGTNTITADLTPALNAYEAGMVVRLKAVGANTGPVTINLNGKGAKTVQFQNAALVGGEIGNTLVHQFMYDGTQFQLLNPVNVATPLWGGTTGGTSTAYTIAPAPAITAYATGQRFSFKAHAACGAAPTIAVSGLAAKAIQYQNVALTSGQIGLNIIHEVVYDGTQFQLLNPIGVPQWGGTTGGTSTAYTITPSPAISAYATGQRFTFSAHAANGATPTLAVNGLATKTIRRQGTSLAGNEFIANDIIDVQYDGTNFQLLNVAPAPLFIDRTNNRVGIGTTTPSERLEVSGNQKFPASGISKIYSFASSGTDVALDLIAGETSYASNGAAIRIQSSGVGNDGYILFSTNLSGTGSAERMRLTNNGRLGIGINTPSYQLQLSGDSAAKPTTNTWTIASDERIKTNIQPYAKGLEDICKVNPVTYDYNGKGEIAAGPGGVSILAQELQPVFPECVGSYKARLNDTDEEETDILNYNGHAITFALINAIKELSSKFESLEARISELEA